MALCRKEEHVLVPLIGILWKCSFNKNCRQVIENDNVIHNILMDLLSYQFNEQVIGYAVATLSELWNSEFFRDQIKRTALPKYLELLRTSQSSLILTHVCVALGRASNDPDCMETIVQAKGFRLVFVLLPSLEIDEFKKYKYYYDSDTIIAAAKCLTQLMKNTQVISNNNT